MSASKLITLVADTDNLIKPTIQITVCRWYPKGKRYEVKVQSGWTTDRMPKFHYRRCTKSTVLDTIEAAKSYYKHEFIVA